MLITIIKTGILENAGLNILLGFCSFSPATQEVYSHVAFIRKENKLRISDSPSGKKDLANTLTFMPIYRCVFRIH